MLNQIERSRSAQFQDRLARAPLDRSGSDTHADPQTCVLIVEDDYLVSLQIETALRDAGYRVCGIASTADSAIALAAAEKPTLAIMDIRLSGTRDGIDAAISLFSAFGVRSIFATAHSDDEVHERANAAAPLGWLQKPYTMASLLSAVREALDELKQPPI